MTKDEAIKVALEWDVRRNFVMPYKVRDALRKALEQPKYENILEIDVRQLKLNV